MNIPAEPAAHASFELKIHRNKYGGLELGYEQPKAWAQLLALDWSTPLLTISDADIASFDWGRQEIALSTDASARFRQTIRVRSRLSGTDEHAFLVSLGGTALYGGILLAPISAMGIRFPVIHVNDRAERIELELRPKHSVSTPYQRVPQADRAAIELPELRAHFAATKKLVGI